MKIQSISVNELLSLGYDNFSLYVINKLIDTLNSTKNHITQNHFTDLILYYHKVILERGNTIRANDCLCDLLIQFVPGLKTWQIVENYNQVNANVSE